MNLGPIGLALILLALSSTGRAEAQTDTLLWTSTGARIRLPMDFDIEAAYQARFDGNASALESRFPEFEIGYEPLSWTKLGLGYRHISERSKSGDLEPVRRLHGQLGLEHDFGPVEVSYRLRYQRKKELDEDDPSVRLRNRLGVQYDTETPFSPFVSTELYTDPVAEPVEHPKMRLTLGVAAKVTKAHRFKLRYHRQAELNEEPDLEHIIVFDYRFVLSIPG